MNTITLPAQAVAGYEIVSYGEDGKKGGGDDVSSCDKDGNNAKPTWLNISKLMITILILGLIAMLGFCAQLLARSKKSAIKQLGKPTCG